MTARTKNQNQITIQIPSAIHARMLVISERIGASLRFIVRRQLERWLAETETDEDRAAQTKS